MNSCCKVCCFLPLQNWKDRGFWKESSTEGSQRNLRIHGSRHLWKSGGQQKSSQLENFWLPAKHFTPLKTNMTLDNSHVQRENTSSGGGCSIVMFVLGGGGYHFGTWRVNQNFETLRSWLFSIPNTCNMQPPPPISSGKEETSHSPATWFLLGLLSD